MTKIKHRRKPLPGHAVSTKSVGYCNPPKEHQFKKGQSGNPKGRPRATSEPESFEELCQIEFGKKITIRENGTKKRITVRALIMKRFINDLLRGDKTAMRLLIQNLEIFQAQGAEDSEGFKTEAGKKIVEVLNAITSKKANGDFDH